MFIKYRETGLLIWGDTYLSFGYVRLSTALIAIGLYGICESLFSDRENLASKIIGEYIGQKYTGNLLSALHITGGIFMDNLFFMVAIPLFYRDEFDKNVRSSVCMLRCGWSGEQGTADSENGFINVANMDER